MQTSDFDYDLPCDLIATHPVQRREEARLMVVYRATGKWEHRFIRDLPEFVAPGDQWVLNNSKVMRSRLLTTDGRIEILLLEETSSQHWTALSFPGKKTKPGTVLEFCSRLDSSRKITAEILKTLETGERVLRFHQPFVLDEFGWLPLPPYIQEKRRANGLQDMEVPEDANRYQTVFAQVNGSVAAPTAGLHFTPELLQSIPHVFVTLHVGIGTFRPVKTKRIEDHSMHAERFEVSSETAQKLAAAQRRVAVGTTSARVLESLPSFQACHSQTQLFVHPPYHFKHTDALLTNFHLPRSTLLMLVAAFLENTVSQGIQGTQWIKELYAEAIRERYRFFSYGDAMLIL